MDIIIHYSEQFSYIGIFVFLLWCGIGFPLPEDAILIAAGFLVYEEITDFWLTIVVAFAGVLIGDTIIYYIGKKFGLGIITHRRFRRILPERRLVKIEKLFNRYGISIVFLARFVAFIRAPIYLSSGALGIRYATFLLFDFLASVLSIPIVVWLGYYFGEEIEMAVQYVRRAEYLILAFLLMVVLYIIRFRRNRLKKMRELEAKAEEKSENISL